MAVDMGFDESGNKDVLLVSAQLGVVQKARVMKTKWKAALRETRVPFFHSVDYDNITKGVFSKLSREERKELLELLAGHLRKRMFVGLTVKVTLSNYNDKTDNEFRSRWAAAYSFCIQVLLSYANLVMEIFHLGDEVNVLIEDGHANVEQAFQILHRIDLLPVFRTKLSMI